MKPHEELLSLVRTQIGGGGGGKDNDDKAGGGTSLPKMASIVDTWLQNANMLVIEQQMQLRSHSAEQQRAAIACLVEGSKLAHDLVRQLVELEAKRESCEERVTLEQQRAEAEEKAAREAESHVVAALQQASSQSQARQAAEKQLSRLVGELEDERDKLREVEDKYQSLEREMAFVVRREQEAAVEVTRRANAMQTEAEGAIVKATRAAREAEDALQAMRGEMALKLQQEAGNAARALAAAEGRTAAEREGRAAEVKRLNAQLQSIKDSEASSIQVVKNEAAEALRRCEVLSKELATSQRELGEVQRMSDVRSRRHEEYIAQAETDKTELMQKLREEEERCASKQAEVHLFSVQFEVESAQRKAAEESVAAKQAEVDAKESQLIAAAQASMAKESEMTVARRAAEGRANAAEAALAELSGRLEAKSVDKEEQKMQRTLQRVEVEVSERKRVEAELSKVNERLAVLQREKSAAEAKVENVSKRMEVMGKGKAEAEGKISQLKAAASQHKEALAAAVNKEREARSGAVKKAKEEAAKQLSAERERAERMRVAKEAVEEKAHASGLEAASKVTKLREELAKAKETREKLEVALKTAREEAADEKAATRRDLDEQLAGHRTFALELEAKLAQVQSDAEEQYTRAVLRAEEAEERVTTATQPLEARVRELEGRLEGAQEQSASLARQLAHAQEEAATANASAAAAAAAAIASPPSSSHASPTVLLYEDVAEATNGFDDGNVVGSGGFGVVYKGSPLASIASAFGQVAVKVLAVNSNKQGHAEMLREIQLLGTTRHEALLPLHGLCLDHRGMCLVYPLMVGGNLEDRLLLTPESIERLSRLGHEQPPPHLTWLQRLLIMRQIIDALVYLHTPSSSKGVELHNDIKPSNILLDGDLNAKLGDVGLGLPIEGGNEGRTHVSLNGVFGTTGFIDPLLSDTQRCSPVTDGYAIGIALLMCLTGLPALDIKARCRRLLCRPDEPAEWEAPGLPDTQAGAWPGRVSRLVARVISGLVMAQFKEDRLPLPRALEQLDEALATAPEDTRPAGPARMGPIIPQSPSPRNGRPGALGVVGGVGGGRASASEEPPPEERECVICMSEPREVRFSCGHAVCCRGCAESLLALEHPCPTCRTSDISMAEIGTFTQQPTYVQQRRPNAPPGLPGVGGLGLPPPPNQQMNRPAGSRQINIPELPGLLGLGGPQPGLPGSVAARLNPRAHSFRQAPPGMGWAGGGGGLGGGLPGFSDVVWAQPQQPTVLPPPQPVLSTDSAPLVPPNPPAAASEDHHSAAPGGSMDSPQLQPLPASWLGEGGDVEGAVLEMEPPPGEMPAAAAAGPSATATAASAPEATPPQQGGGRGRRRNRGRRS